MSAESLDPRQKVVVLRDGPTAGLIGSAVIAGFFAVWSMSLGESPFFVAALLGRALFGGPAGEAAPGTAAAVLAYSSTHLAALVAGGVLMAAVARFVPRATRIWFIAGVAVILCAAHVAILPIWFGDSVRAALPMWLVGSATGLGLLAMSEYLWQRNEPAPARAGESVT